MNRLQGRSFLLVVRDDQAIRRRDHRAIESFAERVDLLRRNMIRDERGEAETKRAEKRQMPQRIV